MLLVRLSARADGNSPLPYKCYAPCTSDAQGHVTECSRPWLDSTLPANAPCMLQLNASAVCSANREHRQTDSLGGGNQYFAHACRSDRSSFQAMLLSLSADSAFSQIQRAGQQQLHTANHGIHGCCKMHGCSSIHPFLQT